MSRDVAEVAEPLRALMNLPPPRRPGVRVGNPVTLDPASPRTLGALTEYNPERRTAERRRQTGIPVGPNLLAKVREVAIASGADWIMDG